MDGAASNGLIGYHYNRPAIFLSNFRGALHGDLHEGSLLRPKHRAVRDE